MTIYHHSVAPLGERGVNQIQGAAGFSIGSITRHDQGHPPNRLGSNKSHGKTSGSASPKTISGITPGTTSHLRQGLRQESQWLLSKIASASSKRASGKKGPSRP